jgi:superfamily II DNA/RNA helicase
MFSFSMLCIFQADFATSAVDFLHRIGRTARAGQIGLVTNMYTESNRELVDAVRRAEELGLPMVNYKTVFIGLNLWTGPYTLRYFNKMYKKYIYIGKIDVVHV